MYFHLIQSTLKIQSCTNHYFYNGKGKWQRNVKGVGLGEEPTENYKQRSTKHIGVF